ncbi:hypothetical protein HMPREF9004_0782 [Schaalia cardiffensis F0333]|uniref:Uncharacterized protein n=1 Tax=Schaalia cardiffensis F0333 TaxID=888050 RepID=N6X413_9ACTO|nr:hypothetical protein HMPREF9004_0782 [Schaalia cardiffensis F0333]
MHAHSVSLWVLSRKGFSKSGFALVKQWLRLREAGPSSKTSDPSSMKMAPFSRSGPVLRLTRRP